MGEPPFLKWLQAATGWDVDESEFLLIGKRIQVLRHAFNARDGIVPAQVTLPARERGEPPQETVPLTGVTLDVQSMACSYFETMGVDPKTGQPLPETAARLGLDGLLAG